MKHINIRTAVGGALAALSLICGLSAPAMADWDQRGHDFHGGPHHGWHEHAWRAHEWRHDHWHGDHYVYRGAYETYAPPMVVEPPPVYDGGDSGVNLVFPLNIH